MGSIQNIYPSLNQDYYFVQNVLPKAEWERIALWIKDFPAYATGPENKFKEFLHPTYLGPLTFSTEHILENQEHFFDTIQVKDDRLKNLHLHLLNRFAKEVHLTGTHTLEFQMLRDSLEPGSKIKQDWFYDQKAHKTMLVILQNDFFEKIPSLDLDVPKSPPNYQQELNLQKSRPHTYLKLFFSHEAIIIHEHGGALMHRLSTFPPLNLESTESLARTVVQITLKKSSS